MMNKIANMTDEVILKNIARISRLDAEVEHHLISYLIVVDQRRLHLKAAFPSLFIFVKDYLKCSEATAGRRIRVAKAAARFPLLLTYIKEQKLTLTKAALIASLLTEQNYAALIEEATSKSTRDIEKMVARVSPKNPRKDTIQVASVEREERAAKGETGATDASQYAGDFGAGEPLIFGATPEVQEKTRYRIAFDADEELVRTLERLKDVLGHKIKDGSLEKIVKIACDELLVKVDPEHKKEAAPSKPKKAPVPKSACVKNPQQTTAEAKETRAQSIKVETRHIPVKIKREVYKRDGGQCAFVSADGKRCISRRALEFDHRQPWALGGSSKDARNIRLLCKNHNLFCAERDFGSRVQRGNATQ